MVHNKRLNVQKFHLGGTPRKVLYHADSRLLLVLRTDLSDDPCTSDICCVDPLSGSVLSSFKFDPGETGKCMELLKVGSEQILVVGTSLSAGPAIMPSGEAERLNFLFIPTFVIFHTFYDFSDLFVRVTVVDFFFLLDINFQTYLAQYCKQTISCLS